LPTKLSTVFVDKMIALSLQWLSNDFDTSHEEQKHNSMICTRMCFRR
jgi:hypothetical protein